MSKIIQAGPATLEIAVAEGVVSLKASVSQSAGGGAATGVASAKASVEIDLSAKQGADLAIALLEAHLPAATSLLEMAKAGIEAELAKIVV